MTLIKKRDVKDYLAARRIQGSRIHVVPAGQAGATGFSGNAPAVVETTPADLNQGFTADHSSFRKPHVSASDSNAPPDPRSSAALGGVRK